jgi:chromate transporter
MQNDSGSPPEIHEGYTSLFLRFLRFGLLAWGGPIAQIAMIRHELVEEEKWISRERFNRVLGVYQALPGPEAHELCVYFGMTARGRFGGFLAGLGFMLPGFVFMFILSWLYLVYGRGLPYFIPIFHGLQAAVGALIVRAIHRIGRHSLTDRHLLGLAAMSAAAELLGSHFLVTLPVLGTVYFLLKERRKALGYLLTVAFMAWVVFSWKFMGAASEQNSAEVKDMVLRAATLPDLLLSGLKSGLFTFGGAYTVIAFLQHDAVEVQAWMTNAQFLDGLALSGALPAPLIIFATFVGFVAGGSFGALVMTTAIFLPSFAFTLIGHSALESIIDSKKVHAFLDGVTAAVVGLTAVTALDLLRAGVSDWRSIAIFIFALLILYLWKAKLAIALIMIASGAAGMLLFQ